MKNKEEIIEFFKEEKFEFNRNLRDRRIECRLLCDKGAFIYTCFRNGYSYFLIIRPKSDFINDDMFVLNNPTLEEIKQLYTMFKKRIESEK